MPQINTHKLDNLIYSFYIFSFPFVHALSITETINPSILISLLLLVSFLTKHKIKFNTQIGILVLFLVNLYLSLIINISFGNIKLVNHTIAWTTSIILFFMIPLFLFKEEMINDIRKIIYLVFYISIIYSIIEYLDVNYLNLGISNILYRPSGVEYDPSFVFGIRSRSFFAESGYFAMFTLLYAPVICYFERERINKTSNIILIVLTSLSMLVTFSTTFFILLIFFSLTIFLFHKNKGVLRRLLIIIFAFVIFYIFFKSYIDIAFDIAIASKFNSTSFSSRESFNTESLDLVLYKSSLLKKIIGFGPGSYDYLNIEAAISTYINLLRDLGIIGLSLFILFYFSILYKLIRSKTALSNYLLISLISSMVFFQTNTSYYFAFSWFIAILALKTNIITEYESKNKHSNRMLQ